MNDHHKYIRASIDAARQARENGNHPFGALLVSPDGEILLTTENTVITEKDITGHAELNLIRQACKQFSPDFLSACTLYASTEPCPMCAGAIFWGNIRRVVYGLSEEGLYQITGEDFEEVLYLPCREIFQKGHKDITVLGPILEEEARKVHEGFWT